MTQETREGPPKPKPKTFEEAFKQLEMTPEEEAAMTSPLTPPEEKTPLEVKAEDPPDPDEIPEWVEFPDGFKIPPNKQIGFMRFRAAWTEHPDKGDRWCLLWPLTVVEERLARQRTRGDSGRTYDEMAKQMIRLIDGKRADWSGTASPTTHSPVEKFWEQIGPKCRPLLVNFFIKTHSLEPKEQADFFLNCLHVRTAKVG